MVHFIEGATVLVRRDADCITLRENPEVSVLGRIVGGLGGLAFVTVATLFWFMEVGGDDGSQLWIRVLLCGGLTLVGLLLGWSALYPRNSIEEISFDKERRELRVTKLTAEGESKLRHTVPFSDIDRFYAGSQASHDASKGGSTILYVEASSGPRNGVLIVGSVSELEQYSRELNTELQEVLSSPAPDMRPATPQPRGFGRKGS